ncbi:MAG: hypothetical protein GW802_39370 [Armatimonadetes bacterium]|nr:hypothetical protein [Armatimonadota bacterium]NCQ33413.1 hypothetical protein [Armatimonadota bacterium]
MEAVILDRVQEYLDDCVGEMTSPGKPSFDYTRREWRVPVLARTTKAIFPVGEFTLDEEGNFLSVPDRRQMTRLLRAQVAQTASLVLAEREELETSGFHVVAA